MPDSSLPLQVAVVAALRGSADLTALVGPRIYDRIPDNQPRPFVAMASWVVRNDDTDCGDAAAVSMSVLCYSDKPGRQEVGQIAGAVKDALHRLEPDGGEIRWQDTIYSVEDGLVSQAVVRFEALLDG